MAKKITNKQLVEYAKKAKGHPYWYGCFGQISTKKLYESKKAQYEDYYNWKLPKSQLGTRVFDCVGLIKGAIWSGGDINSKPVFRSSQDVSANGMFDRCEKKGKISSMPDVPGVLVFKSHHVGVYIGNGKVIEARGHAYGVVETVLKERGWVNWGYCPYITYEISNKPSKKKPTSSTKPVNTKPTTTTKPKTETQSTKKIYSGNFPILIFGIALSFGSKGNDVKRLQKFLNWYGNYKLKVDGIFGSATQKAVRDFQKKNNLVVDGKFGKKSLAKAKTIKK